MDRTPHTRHPTTPGPRLSTHRPTGLTPADPTAPVATATS